MPEYYAYLALVIALLWITLLLGIILLRAAQQIQRLVELNAIGKWADTSERHRMTALYNVSKDWPTPASKHQQGPPQEPEAEEQDQAGLRISSGL